MTGAERLVEAAVTAAERDCEDAAGALRDTASASDEVTATRAIELGEAVVRLEVAREFRSLVAAGLAEARVNAAGEVEVRAVGVTDV
jgi:hypothetical protein